MIAHTSLPVSDYKKSKEFYTQALAPLGYELKRPFDDYETAGYMQGGNTDFWIAKKDPVVPSHVAFLAESKDAVQGFYDAARKAGGADNGGPGFRTDYGPDYYAAFVLDLDGNNLEACYFGERAPGM